MHTKVILIKLLFSVGGFIVQCSYYNILFPFTQTLTMRNKSLVTAERFLVKLKHDTRHNCWSFFRGGGGRGEGDHCLIYMAKVPSVPRLIHSITINNIQSKRKPNRALLKEIYGKTFTAQ